MADVTTSFAAKDESFASTVDKLSGRLRGFQGETESFTQKVGNMASQFAAFVGPIAAVGAAFLGARGIVNSFRDAIDMGGKLNDLSARTGETAGNLAILQRAFENAGSSGEAVGPMLNRLQRFMVEAGEGGKAQTEAMNKLGLSYETLKTMTPTAQMELLAQKISAIPDPAQRSALAMEIFGRSGGELMPLLRAMSAELDTARAQLGGYPEVIDRTSKALDDIGDNFNAISTKSREFATGLLVNLAPALVDITDKISKIDAAGFGMAISNYFASFMQAATGAYRLGEALDSVKLAIEAMGQGDIGGGLKLMWVTMRNTALNAVNEIFANFRAGLQTIAQFIGTMFDSQGALAMVFQTMFRVAANYLKESLYGALAEFMDAIGRSGMADTFRYEAETASKAIKAELFSVGSQIELVGEQAAEAGRAMPENFAKNKAALDPLFDLKDEFAEQAKLQEVIRAKLGESAQSAESVATSSKEVSASLTNAAAALAQGDSFSKAIALNLNNASLASKGVPAAFDLGADSTGKMSVDLNNTGKAAEKAKGWLEKGAGETEKISIHGNSLANSGNAFSAAINQAKIDAKVTANVFTGLSDRMNRAVNGTSKMLDQMRESFHFGRETARETYERLRDGGMNINDATKAAADYTKQQNQADVDLRRLETSERLAANQRDRAYERADRMEQMRQEASASRHRQNADALYTKKMESLRPELEKATENAKRLMQEGGEEIKRSARPVGESGSQAGQMLKDGGSAAGQSIQDAADALKNMVDNISQQLALEATLQKCSEFLKSIDKKLPQNSLS
jgi:hypothetical protein